LATKNKDIHISINKIVHTGAKARFGATKAGLISIAYHSPIAGVVNHDPITHANNGIAKHSIKVKI
jgi:hypothetical protein